MNIVITNYLKWSRKVAIMEKLFDIKKFDSYKEDNRREVKKANGGLPIALWDTYSSFANTYG